MGLSVLINGTQQEKLEWTFHLYDLDGDGVVGNRDLVISKLFDKDGDGKLNAEERRNAEEAIKNVSARLILS